MGIVSQADLKGNVATGARQVPPFARVVRAVEAEASRASELATDVNALADWLFGSEQKDELPGSRSAPDGVVHDLSEEVELLARALDRLARGLDRLRDGFGWGPRSDGGE